MNAPSDPGDRALDASLAALPRHLPPARDLWPAIEAAIAPPAARALRPARWRYALAAGLATCAVGGLLVTRSVRQPIELASVQPLPGSRIQSLPARAVALKEDDYRATRAALETTYQERLAMLAPVTRARIAEDLASIRQAQEDIRKALTADPGSQVLLRLYESTTQQEFDLYSTIGRTTEPVVPRTRT